jgi:hypothetical protein
MIIIGKRIRSLERHLAAVKQGTTLVFAKGVDSRDADLLGEIGFSKQMEEGETVLPSPRFGPISRFNADGKERVHRDRPMETAHRQAEWTWQEWNGPYDTVERSKIVDIPYQRYPRTVIPPPSVELAIRKRQGISFIVTPPIEFSEKNKDTVLHYINLMLELFGVTEVLMEDLQDLITQVPVKSLNWKVLPPGEWPWKRIKPEVEKILDTASKGNRPVIEHRLETVSQYGAEFVAIGRAGFRGYIIFAFPKRTLYVLESAYTGNATYVFSEDWERLSKLTKAEILQGNLQEDRIIHRQGWENRLRSLLDS